ncbi:hypothetical protein FDP41_006740 [Naegleria fowleri]|uniref:Uncharacterized protein n=1 Tax=Naegleria fowleri TaxID=5763 RepID=A0A6A5BJD9_NAEFO|nr:uncharacterized protein FDP41_006740 [Naegleria fowleri]KAF0974130.1 hypothetical protein FDP41_006740 [Naegleria fowleri]CAG4717615.1 unnamed protein product [Naegleria fowleri]
MLQSVVPVRENTDHQPLTTTIPSSSPVHDDYEIHDGKSDHGSIYKIVVPKSTTWRLASIKGIYIWCHGYRPLGIPLTAIFDYHAEPYATLLRRGFILASTSYRREGYILKDAVEDIDELRRFILDQFVSPNDASTPYFTVLLEAESMGGAIVTLLNERYSRQHYHGIIATGAALFIQKDPVDNPIQFLFTPHIPQIYICNSSEVSIVKEYIEKSKEEKKRDSSIIIPNLLTVEREGHCEVFTEEIQIAFSALFEWLKDESYFDNLNQESHDITLYSLEMEREFNSQSSSKLQIVTEMVNSQPVRGVWILVDEVSLYNEVILRIGREDFRKLFIYPYNQFTMYVSNSSKSNEKFSLDTAKKFEILHASYPFAGIDVGTLVSSFNIDDNLIIRRHFTGNNLNAAGTEMGVQISHWVFILEKEMKRTSRFNQ